jgi:hypothetical protein
MLGILYHETKIETNSRNSVLNHCAEQKTRRILIRTILQSRKVLGISFRGKKIEANSREVRFEACLGQKHAVYSVAVAGFFVKLVIYVPSIFFRSEPRN